MIIINNIPISNSNYVSLITKNNKSCANYFKKNSFFA